MSGTPSKGDYSERTVLRNVQTDVEAVQSRVADSLAHFKYEGTEQFAIRLALEEGLTNAFRHGNKNDPAKSVRFLCRISAHEAYFEIEDEGPGFDPETVPDPTSDENIEIPSGRGIMLIRAYMSEVEYLKPGNRLRMLYRRP
ncbi:MAG: ATP-binding protein [Phycisphaerae bacterium]|nr:ATP-binding protein [Phycisphaerae bacterium]